MKQTIGPLISKLDLDQQRPSDPPPDSGKTMRRFLKVLLPGILLCLVVVGLAIAIHTVSSGSGSAESVSDPSAFRVAMITDYGSADNQQYNQTVFQTCSDFCDEEGLQFAAYEPSDDSTVGRVAMIDMAVAEGYNLIVLPGNVFAESVVETQDYYPEVKFIVLDVSMDDLDSAFYRDGELIDPDNEPHVGDNVLLLTFREERGGFMAGFAAVKLGYTRLGFLGSMPVSAVIRYGSGFVQGANAAAEELGRDIQINYVYGGQSYGDGEITAAMDAWYQTGTEVVFAAGGGIWTSAAEAAAKTGGKIIGADVDQSAEIDGSYGAGMTLTSAVKNPANELHEVLTAAIHEDDSGAPFGAEIQSFLCMQLPIESTQWAEGFTKDDYDALVASMAVWDYMVSDDITKMPSVGSHVTLNDQGQIK